MKPSVYLLLGLLAVCTFCNTSAKSVWKRDVADDRKKLVPAIPTWAEFKAMFKKQYSSPEMEKEKEETYNSNVAEIKLCNENFLSDRTAFYCGVNKHADIKVENFAMFAYLERVNGHLRAPERNKSRGETFYLSSFYGKSRDWIKTLFAVNNDVKIPDQGERCHAGYAFAAAAVLEAQFYQLTHTKVKFSEQQIIDCTTREANRKCDGGYIISVFNYFMKRGIMLAEDYPYTGKPGRCQYHPQLSVAKVRKYQQVNNDESFLHKYLRNYGPVAATLNANISSLQFYKGGIYNDPNCLKEKNTHAVIITGLGVDNGVPYWTIRNSFGPTWGENGYGRIYRGNNMCGIAMHTSIPELRLVNHKKYPPRIAGLTTIKPVIPKRLKKKQDDDIFS